LLVLGLHHLAQQRRVLGDFVLRIARETDCPLLILGQRYGSRRTLETGSYAVRQKGLSRGEQSEMVDLGLSKG